MESQHAPHPPLGVPSRQHGGHPSQVAATFGPQEGYRYPETHPQAAPGPCQNPSQPFVYVQHAQQASNPYQYQSQLHAPYYDPRLSQSGPQYFGPPHGAPPHHVPPHPVHGMQQPPPQQHSAQQNPYVAPSGYPTYGQHARIPSPAHQFDNRGAPSEQLRTNAPPNRPPSMPAPNTGTYASANEPVARGLVPPPDGHIPIALGQDKTQGDAARIWFSLSHRDQCHLFNEWNKARGMDVDPPSTSGRRKTKSKRKAPNASGDPPGAATSAPQGRFTTRCEDVSDDEQLQEPNVSQSPSTSFAGGAYGNAKGKERAHDTDMAFTDPRPQYGSAHTQPAGAPSEPHFGVLMLDGLNRLESRMGRIEDSFVRLTGRQPATGASAANESSGIPRNAEGGDEESDGDGGDAEDEDEDGDEDEDEDDQEQKRADKPHKITLAKYVRFHMDVKLMKLKAVKKLAAKFPPLTAAEIAAYEAHDGPFVTADNYRPDFVQGWKKATYNREVRMFTVDDFLAALKGGSYNDPPLPDRFRTRKRIECAVDGHMKHLRDTYREQTHEQTPEFLLKLENTRLRKRCNTRKHTTLRVRRRTIDRHDLDQLRTLYAKLAAEHMSGDEEVVAEDPNGTKTRKQAHPRKYHIVDAAWQSRDFAKCSRTLDLWNTQDWGHFVGGRLPGGSGPRERIALAKPRVVNSAAPRGLWRNCYSKKWLKKQKPYARKQLKIVDEDFDFGLPVYSTPPDLENADFGLTDGDEDESGDEDGTDVQME